MKNKSILCLNQVKKKTIRKMVILALILLSKIKPKLRLKTFTMHLKL